jgi:hypothetical protein
VIGIEKNSTEDLLVLELLEKPLTAKSLISILEKKKNAISYASLYDQLNKLIDKHILIKTGKMYSINAEWFQKIRDLFTPKNQYILKKGEKMRYQLKKLSRAEMYWKHIMHSLYVSYPDESVYMYNPHSFWSLIPGRTESEDTYVEHHEKNKRNGYYILGGTTIHDINLRKKYSAQYFKVDIQAKDLFKRNEYITVLGDLVFTMSLPTALAKKIDKIYLDTKTEEDILRAIAELEDYSWNISSVVENNPKKAYLLKKKIAKNFLTKTEIEKRIKHIII